MLVHLLFVISFVLPPLTLSTRDASSFQHPRYWPLPNPLTGVLPLSNPMTGVLLPKRSVAEPRRLAQRAAFSESAALLLLATMTLTRNLRSDAALHRMRAELAPLVPRYASFPVQSML